MPLIVLDAIDGAGKSTVIRGIADHFRAQGKAVFDLVAYMQEHGSLPEVDGPELANINVLISAEPTYCWVGKAIREEVIKTHPHRIYDVQTIARFFSEDRLILFKHVILPFLQSRADRWVIQDRGCITSLTYQPLDARIKGDTTVTESWIASLPGNALELSRPPELLLLLRLAPAVAMDRLAGRTSKVDGDVFEIATFQEQLALRYRDPQVLAPYKNAGTAIVEVDASQTPERVVAEALRHIIALAL
ncbi:MAG: hypothetical protein WCV84_05750 [Patescibacteria group bacterium]